MTQRPKLHAITHRSGAGRSSATLPRRGAAHIAGVEVLPEVWVDKAAVGEHTPCRVVGRRVRLALHQEGLGDRLVLAVPSVDVVLVRPRRLARVFDVAVAAIARDLRAEPRGAVLAVVLRRGHGGVLHPGRPPLQHGLAALKGSRRDFGAEFLLPLGEPAREVGRFLLGAIDRCLEFRRPPFPYFLALGGYLPVGALDLR